MRPKITVTHQAMEVTPPGGVRIVGLPVNSPPARGFTGDVFLDEFAMYAHDI